MSVPETPVVVADLDALRTMLGTQTTRDDDVLRDDLAAATEWVSRRVMVARFEASTVQLAILLLAARLYSRRKSPEGVSGFGLDGLIVRIVSSDPDIRSLLEQELDLLQAGIA